MPMRLKLYISAIMLAAAVSGYFVMPGTPWHSVPLAPFLALVALQGAVVATVRVPALTQSPAASAAVAVLLAAVVLLPLGAATLLGGLSALVLILRRTPLPRLAFVISCGVLVPALGGLVYRSLEGSRSLQTSQFPGAFGPIGLAVLTLSVVPAVCLGLFEVCGGKIRPADAARYAVRHGVPHNIGYSLVGLITAVLWANDYQVLAALILLSPLAVTRWATFQYAAQHAAHDATIRALVQAVEIKDLYTRGHSERVARISEMIARRLNLGEDRIGVLRYAAILHDVGKLGVPTRLLQKTGRLDAEEVAAIRLHPVRGVDVVRDIAFLDEAYRAILHHHERMDGLGYPSGLSGERIPRFARIIAVADAFDSMTSTRSYRGARSVQDALDELRRCAGSQFDPAMVRAIEAALEKARLDGLPWTGDGTVPEPGAAEGGRAPAEPAAPGEPAAAGPLLPIQPPAQAYDHDDPAFAVAPGVMSGAAEPAAQRPRSAGRPE